MHEATSGNGANRDPGRDRGAVTYPLPADVIVDRSVMVPMRDGVRLSATICRPDRPGRFPVIMCVTVYGKDFGPADYATLPKIKKAGMAVGTMHISDVTTWEGPDPGFWVPHGYVVVVANARGYYESEGEPGLYSNHDAEDYADLIEWAGVQGWSNGAVGLNGVSYLAISQWMVASQERSTHLRAIIPWEGATDLLRDCMAPGGIPETRFLGGYYAGSLARGAGEEIVASGPAMMDRVAQHPFPLENIKVPALICASWSDHGLHSRGSVEGFTRISSSEKWMYTHGGNKWEVYYSPDALDWQKSFFDRFLKGEDNGFERRPPIRLELRQDSDTFEVRSETSWPPASAAWTPLYLDPTRARLSLELVQAEEPIIYDATAKQTVDFDLRFERRTEIAGPMVLKLWVAALDADDLDLFVAVRKLDCEGHEIHFCGKDGYRKGVPALGWLRVSQRHQDPERSKPWRPWLTHDRSEKLAAGEIVPVEIEILPTGVLFEAGDTLRLSISGQDIVEHGRFGHDDLVNSGRHAIHAGGACASHLLLPIL